jgi:polar amino acid transport system permease protein
MDLPDLAWLKPYAPLIMNGLLLTLALSILTCTLGMIIGICAGVVQSTGGHQRSRVVAWLASSYVELFRNTPLLAQVFFCFFGLAGLGLRLSPISAAIIALVLNCGAYCSDIFRAGFSSINVTQHEASECLALSRMQSFLYVVLPQVMRVVWVSLSGQFVLMILASSVVSQISVDELTSAASQIQSMTFRSFEVYLLLAIGYFVIAMAFKFLLHWVGAKFFKEPAQPAPRLRRFAQMGVVK